MKVLEVVNFSGGISGTWTRALEDAKAFKEDGHSVNIYSSNKTEDGIIIKHDEKLNGINIKRFPIKKRKGYALWFDFEKEALELKPDVIIAHGLRKPYLNKVVRLKKLLKCKIFLITHAPFIDKKLRSKKLNSLIWLYDKFVGKGVMKSFDKIVTICKWEKEELLKLGCKEDKIIYIPNSLSEEFFTTEPKQSQKKILFMGRMNPIKEIEVLMKAFKEANLTDYVLEIVSSQEGEYFKSLQQYKTDNIIFTKPIYDLDRKIEKIDECEIFVLPSRKESLPFGLIEAMARGKIVIATNTEGGIELIKTSSNGFLFDIGNEEQLKSLLIGITSNFNLNGVVDNARKTAEEFRLKNNLLKWEELFND